MKTRTTVLILTAISLMGMACGKKGGGNSTTTTVACKVTADCKSGEVCTAGICATSTTGATCKADTDCASGEVCLPAQAGQANVCTKPVTTVDTPPTLEIVSPVNGSTVTNQVTVEARVTDAKGIDRVEFYQGGLIKATVKAAPYTWTAKMDPGTQVIKVKVCNIVSLCTERDVIITVHEDLPNPPTVSFSAPVTSEVVGSNYNVVVTATGVLITKVEIYLDSVLQTTIPTISAKSYQWSWPTTTASNGNHILKAIATDVTNQTAQQEIIVLVQNTPPDQPPSVSITNPTNGSVIATTTNITATANDVEGVVKGEFYIDNILKSTDTSSPYSYSWNPQAVANGSHTIKVIAYDTANQTGTATVNVTVNNPVVASITITAPNAGGDTNIFYPTGPTIYVPKEDGSHTEVYELVAQAKDSGGNTITGIPFSWSTATAAIATYTQSGSYNERITVATHMDWFDNGSTVPITTFTVTADGFSSQVTVMAIINIDITTSNLNRKWYISYNGSAWQGGYVDQRGKGFTHNVPSGSSSTGAINGKDIAWTRTGADCGWGPATQSHTGTFSNALNQSGTYTTTNCGGNTGTWVGGN